MKTEVDLSIIPIFEFFLSDHHAQVKSTPQDIVRRSTFLCHGNHSFRLSRHNIIQFKHVHHHYLDDTHPFSLSDLSLPRRSQFSSAPLCRDDVMMIIISVQLWSSSPSNSSESDTNSNFHHYWYTTILTFPRSKYDTPPTHNGT